MSTLLNKINDNHVIEEKDIYDIAATYIKNNNLESYLCDIIFSSNKNILAHYNITRREIVFNDERILASCYKLYDKLQRLYQINENNYTYFLNYYYLYIVYHELEHVSQRALYEENSENDDIYNYLYVLCSILHSNDKSFYKINHDIFPMEIDANNTGYLKAYEILMQTNLPVKELKIMYLQYLFSLSYNYEKNRYVIKTPIELLKTKNSVVDMGLINELLKHSKLSTIERMNLGLPITTKEYDNVNRVKRKSLINVI